MIVLNQSFIIAFACIVGGILLELSDNQKKIK